MNIFKQKRKSLQMTQKEFANRTGLSVPVISKMEKGELSLTTAMGFCNAFQEEYEIKNMSVGLK